MLYCSGQRFWSMKKSWLFHMLVSHVRSHSSSAWQGSTQRPREAKGLSPGGKEVTGGFTVLEESWSSPELVSQMIRKMQPRVRMTCALCYLSRWES